LAWFAIKPPKGKLLISKRQFVCRY